MPRRSIASLDLLRFLAAISVVVYHFFFFGWNDHWSGPGIGTLTGRLANFPSIVPFSWWGWEGVYIFFVISGFVILKTAEGKTAPQFAVARIERLYPALLFFSTLSFIIIAKAGNIPLEEALDRWLRAVTLFPMGPWTDGAIWTLTVEAVFYCLIALCLWRAGHRQIEAYASYATIVLTIFWLIVYLQLLFGSEFLGNSFLNVAARYYAAPLLLQTGPFFLVGIFCYEIHRDRATFSRVFHLALSILVSSAALYFIASRTIGAEQYGQSPLVPVLIWLLVMFIGGAMLAYEKRHPPGKSMQRFCRTIGLMTYPIYLENQIIGGWFLGKLCLAGYSSWAAVALSTAAVLVTSLIFALWMEPAIRRILFDTRPWNIAKLQFAPESTGIQITRRSNDSI